MCVAEGEVGEGDEHEPGDLVTAGVGGGAAVEAGLALQSHGQIAAHHLHRHQTLQFSMFQ